ncbi:MAG TPA: DUF4380 domain-containing protein [Polyangiales bacterium]|nr:DUF4380 domain-containing protein [Polyangiales bacterium]
MTPIERQGKYVLEFGDVLFEIDPMLGGRITKCQIAGQNLLTGPDVDSVNFGSTFWPSPQARWNWPPVPEIDSQPYTGSVSGESVMLVSSVGQRAKVKVSKRFSARPSDGAIDIEYTLSNEDSAAVSWAPWEITRVAPRGITFFPTGMASVNTQLPIMVQGATAWFQHDPSKIAMGGQKFTGDGSKGWLAHAAGDKLLLKRWADVPLAMQAPAPEAEIEIYAAAGYVEIEPQGPYTQLMPGQSVSWSVRWYLRRLPAELMPAVGSAELVSFAESLAGP